MAKKQTGSKKKSGNKKHGREKRKAANRGNPISLFVRDRITAQQYWNLTKIKAPRNGSFCFKYKNCCYISGMSVNLPVEAGWHELLPYISSYTIDDEDPFWFLLKDESKMLRHQKFKITIDLPYHLVLDKEVCDKYFYEYGYSISVCSSHARAFWGWVKDDGLKRYIMEYFAKYKYRFTIPTAPPCDYREPANHRFEIPPPPKLIE